MVGDTCTLSLVFDQGGEIDMYINFRSQNFYTFLVIWTHVLLLY